MGRHRRTRHGTRHTDQAGTPGTTTQGHRGTEAPGHRTPGTRQRRRHTPRSQVAVAGRGGGGGGGGELVLADGVVELVHDPEVDPLARGPLVEHIAVVVVLEVALLERPRRRDQHVLRAGLDRREGVRRAPVRREHEVEPRLRVAVHRLDRPDRPVERLETVPGRRLVLVAAAGGQEPHADGRAPRLKVGRRVAVDGDAEVVRSARGRASRRFVGHGERLAVRLPGAADGHKYLKRPRGVEDVRPQRWWRS